LKVQIVVAHLDHGLRKNASQADVRWVKALAKRLGYKALTKRVDVRTLATRRGENLEQAARRARYTFLADVAEKEQAAVILTAHTMDDQAETFLLNLLRGAGMDGLGAMTPARPLAAKTETLLGRPLLAWARRRDTEAYCRLRGVEFRVDEMNVDERFTRVRARRQLLPLMESFNPKVVEALVRTAELLREDASALDAAAGRLLDLSSEADPSRSGYPRLRIDLLLLAAPALRRRALRQWIVEWRGDLKKIERVHLLAVESLLFGDRGGRAIELPGGAKIVRRQKWLQFSS
jgi:tRNA(Ile)-lysidine synthase